MRLLAEIILNEPFLALLLWINFIGWSGIGLACVCCHYTPRLYDRYFGPIVGTDPGDNK